MDYEIAVLGGGPMGLILAEQAARTNRPIRLWNPDKRAADRLNRTRHTRLMNETFRLPENIDSRADMEFLKTGNWVLLTALSSRQLEEQMHKLLPNLDKEGVHTIGIFTKGLVSSAGRKKYGAYTFGDYLDALAAELGLRFLDTACVTGPSLLSEVKTNHYSFFEIGCRNIDSVRVLREILESDSIQVQSSEDRLGMELSGVLKNPIALACGLAEVLPGCGSNFQGELMGIGFSEMLKFALELGADPATLLGRAGLADVIATAVSSASRNRAYGRKFAGDFLTGQSRTGILERVNLLMNPGKFIEKQAARNRDTVEGAFALAGILEIAKEKGLELPLYQTLFDILSRQAAPTALAGLLSKNHIMDTHASGARKQKGLEYVRGRSLKSVMEKRVLDRVRQQPGMQTRIVRQSSMVLKNLERRRENAAQSGNKRERRELPLEIELWKNLQNAEPGLEGVFLRNLVEYYGEEIADSYRAGMREFLIRLLGPTRFLLGGLRPGAGFPIVGGALDEVRKAAENYNILYAPTHRSHLDSVEVAFGLTWKRLPVPRYAAGINLMASPIWSWLLRSFGAYAVDRERTRNLLYLECLGRYSELLLETGIPSLVYAEGTRSRTGGILPLKTGLLSTAIEAYRASGREVVVVPVALSYENVPEDTDFMGHTEQQKFMEFIRKRTRVYMDLCDPIPVSRYIKHEDPTHAIGDEITRGWRRHMRILPNQILARMLVDNKYALRRADATGGVRDFIQAYPGNYLHRDPEKILKHGMKVLKNRNFIETADGRIHGKAREYLDYYAGMVRGGL